MGLMSRNDDKEKERVATLIDQNLKTIYSDLVQEELPDRFKDLLAVLKAQDAGKKDSQ
ncbi:NepR family anti-sigma factor [Neptunicoccus sediminis]|uniref:NepR family anti-sigma factor n=1 Tax=Neptunicoccus sediminis TaxID=1892596 RepID=UPI0012FF9BB1|nr:NepR family anti-sigma factor [Neptunicoccus sediminis]